MGNPTTAVTKLASAASNASTYPQVVLPLGAPKDEMLVQINVAGQATVTLDGRLNSAMPWTVGITSARTASEIIPIAYVPMIRCVVSAASAASVDVALFHAARRVDIT